MEHPPNATEEPVFLRPLVDAIIGEAVFFCLMF